MSNCRAKVGFLDIIMFSGVTATIVNDGCMTPWDVVKQRMQVTHSPFRSLAQCFAETWRQGGMAAFYKSYWTTVSRENFNFHIPFSYLNVSNNG